MKRNPTLSFLTPKESALLQAVHRQDKVQIRALLNGQDLCSSLDLKMGLWLKEVSEAGEKTQSVSDDMSKTLADFNKLAPENRAASYNRLFNSLLQMCGMDKIGVCALGKSDIFCPKTLDGEWWYEEETLQIAIDLLHRDPATCRAVTMENYAGIDKLVSLLVDPAASRQGYEALRPMLSRILERVTQDSSQQISHEAVQQFLYTAIENNLSQAFTALLPFVSEGGDRDEDRLYFLSFAVDHFTDNCNAQAISQLVTLVGREVWDILSAKSKADKVKHSTGHSHGQVQRRKNKVKNFLGRSTVNLELYPLLFVAALGRDAEGFEMLLLAQLAIYRGRLHLRSDNSNKEPGFRPSAKDKKIASLHLFTVVSNRVVGPLPSQYKTAYKSGTLGGLKGVFMKFESFFKVERSYTKHLG